MDKGKKRKREEEEEAKKGEAFGEQVDKNDVKEMSWIHRGESGNLLVNKFNVNQKE